MIVVGDHLPNSVAQPNVFRSRRGRGQKNLRSRRVRILLEKVMLHLPGIVVAEPIGQGYLVERLMKEVAFVAFIPRPRQLELVENSEAHFHPLLQILLSAAK